MHSDDAMVRRNTDLLVLHLSGIGADERVALFEVGMSHSVGETFTADTDALEHTVARQLVHDQLGFEHTCNVLLRSLVAL